MDEKDELRSTHGPQSLAITREEFEDLVVFFNQACNALRDTDQLPSRTGAAHRVLSRLSIAIQGGR